MWFLSVRIEGDLHSLINSVLIVHSFWNNWHFIMEIWRFKKNKIHQQLELSCLGATLFCRFRQHEPTLCRFLFLAGYWLFFLFFVFYQTLTRRQRRTYFTKWIRLMWFMTTVHGCKRFVSHQVFPTNQRKAWLENNLFLNLW